ncbi:hypothetical protein ACTI_84120 [Actinoplanes sp. OR16]|nr:hypothetical protein ACTI_84120 [Actinoplanes sp. OR16]
MSLGLCARCGLRPLGVVRPDQRGDPGVALSGNSALLGIHQKVFGQAFQVAWGAGLTAPLFEELGKGAGVLLLLFLAPRVVRTAYDRFILGAFVAWASRSSRTSPTATTRRTSSSAATSWVRA